MSTKLTSKLPKDDQSNGLNDIAHRLVSNPTDLHVAVVVLDCSQVTTDIDTESEVPTARIRRIEVISRAEDKATLGRLATRAFEQRTGKTVLPLELEDELRAAFGDTSSTDDQD